MEKSFNMHLDLIQSKDIWKLCSQRKGETKLGEKMLAGSDYADSDLQNCPAQFVIVGIPEDVGPRANEGRGGASSAWKEFLSKFLNVQETELLSGQDILLLGAFNFNRLEGYEFGSLKQLRKVVEQIDEEVTAIIERIVAANKSPIVIGGGHNNCYGLLKGTSKALQQAINCRCF